MLDIKKLRESPSKCEELLKRKSPEVSLERVLDLDEKIRALKTRTETLKAKRNVTSKEIGKRKQEGLNADDIVKEAADISAEIHAIDHELHKLEELYAHEMALLPNIPMEDVPVSQDPKDNLVVKEFKEKPVFDFAPKNHLELNADLGIFDFERAGKIAGSGFPIYRGVGAMLEWALIRYMLKTHVKHGFEPWILPALVRPETMYDSGQLPKFENQQFGIHDPDYNLYLIPTAEVPLNGLHAGEILDEEDLPLRYVAYTPCFRREAGAAGEKERGLIRTHQFNKVEMFVFCKPEASVSMLDSMIVSAEEILQGLDLHYRRVLLVTGDMSFASTRTVDLEVWLPGQDRYYEVSSLSNCHDFQARRSKIRFRKKGEKPEVVHTLNGSGLATSRLMVALLENNQQPDGSVIVPQVLRDELGGIDRICPR